MNTNVNFEVYGKIVQWKRVKSRFNPITKKVISNNNPDQIIYQNLVKEAYKNKCNGTPHYFGADVPICLEIEAYYSIPKSMPKKYQRMLENGARIRRLRTPDNDNLIKNIADALNKIAWGDDKQLSIRATSYWTYGPEHLKVNIYQEDDLAW